MAEPFRWTNSNADVQSSANKYMAQAYVRDVIEPSLSALEHQIDAMRERQHDPIAVFGIGPAQVLARATLLGYVLSLQAMWEKQLREYLRSCALHLKADPAVAREVDAGDWTQLNRLFEQLRGVALAEFDEYEDLNLLHLLGNVCRHGPGASLRRLQASNPELWTGLPQGLEAAQDSRSGTVPTADNMDISFTLLKKLASAIDSFWLETEYIYNESITSKHPNLERILVEERRKRAGRGRPWDPPA